jgi:UDP-N-acetyl-alpha-D-muramoyl-L-alanyl-L-glutamate epimerase
MSALKNLQLYHSLRKKHPWFVYEKFTIEKGANQIQIRWFFNLADRYFFQPTLTIPARPFIRFSIDDALLQNLAFHIGMVEMVSYWKAACPPKVIIRAGALNQHQLQWWKKLYYNGLGEFFYVNGISPSPTDFMEMECTETSGLSAGNITPDDSVLVPVGGGKDSTVSLDLIKTADYKTIPFILNPRKASLATARAAGFDESQCFVMHRKLDAGLLQLNDQGFLNGHTPFSALLAFVTLLVAALSNSRFIALSNESSANEPTIPGTNINHQYSKSFEFEQDFRSYVAQFITKEVEYFSFLRPLNELQIGKIFSGLSHQHEHFRSCNAGSKTDSWCGKCPKCLFTWIILAPFLDEDQLLEIFGTHLLNNRELLHMLEQLSGIAEEKPFECVGTIHEVNTALALTISKNENNPLPLLLKYYHTTANYERYSRLSTADVMNQFDQHNFLSERFKKILQEAIR